MNVLYVFIGLIVSVNLVVVFAGIIAIVVPFIL